MTVYSSMDISFCANRECPHAKENPPCGRSVRNLDGQHAIVSMCGFKPNADGSCDDWMPPAKYKVPKGMEEYCLKLEREREAENARRAELKDADSLDTDE